MKLEAYFNDVVYGLEKALYYERGRGAYFRATMVGVDFIKFLIPRPLAAG